MKSEKRLRHWVLNTYDPFPMTSEQVKLEMEHMEKILKTIKDGGNIITSSRWEYRPDGRKPDAPLQDYSPKEKDWCWPWEHSWESFPLIMQKEMSEGIKCKRCGWVQGVRL